MYITTNSGAVLKLTNEQLDALLFAIDEGIEVAEYKFRAAQNNLDEEEDIIPYRERFNTLKELHSYFSSNN